MVVVGPGGLAPARFALSPDHQYLAVGMGTSAEARVEFLRLPREDEEKTMHVECVLEAPGLRSIAWSDIPLPGGYLAGGFDDGALRIWSPASTLLDNFNEYTVTLNGEGPWILNKDPGISKSEESQLITGINKMYTEIDEIPWTEWEEVMDWEVIENDTKSLGWELMDKTGVEYHKTTPMNLLMEMQMSKPVLALSFSDLTPYWMATAAFSDSICVHDLHYCHLSKRKLEISEPGAEHKFGATSVKWSRNCPTMLASSGDLGAKIWDIRAPLAHRALTSLNDKLPSSDLEFSWGHPMHIAVSSRASATVKIWDLRNKFNPLHTYDSGASGVLSLSWNSLGHLLACHTDGRISCYDAYEKKMVQGVDHLPHCDLGLSWTHSENVAVTLSSQMGVKLCKMGGD